jgi:hypothetical protein
MNEAKGYRQRVGTGRENEWMKKGKGLKERSVE